MDFVGKVISLLFNMLSKLVIAFLPRSTWLLISWLQSTICSDFRAPKNKLCHCFHCFPIYLPWSYISWMLSIKPTFSLSSFTFIKRFFTSSSLSVMKVVSSAYVRLLIVLPAILIPVCALSNPAFLMMYYAYKLNKQGDNIQPWPTPFPIWNQSVVSCPNRTVPSWPAYRFVVWSTQSKALA